jgi:hypothetical protein
VKTHVIIPDSHAHPDFNNDRAALAGKLIADVKPDVVVNIGDQWDMASLSSYDVGTKGFVGRSYQRDIIAGQDFSERLWKEVRGRKKKLPSRYFFVGNHEQRIFTAINSSPQLEGTDYGVSMSDLDLSSFYDEVVYYDGGTPGIKVIDGIAYAHYFTSGVKGLPIGGEHQAYTLLAKNFMSSVQGHTHTSDFAQRTDATGKRLCGLVCGVFQDYHSEWAGAANNKWWHGAVVLRGVEDGQFTPQFISMKELYHEYG